MLTFCYPPPCHNFIIYTPSISSSAPAINHLRHIRGTQDQDYTYDPIGNLTSDATEGITSIEWTVYGKVKEVVKGSTTISYLYDAMGHRVQKTVNGITTTYLRDASGNVMATYSGSSVEHTIYGSSRLGIYKGGREVGQRKTGLKNYELSNHLGNVLAVISDKKLLTGDYFKSDVVSASDYYPFGLAMPKREYQSNNYRYSFNGAERDDEIKGAGNSLDFGERMQDPRLGRFLSLDRFAHKFPSQSGYVFASNTPIAAIDKNGDSTYVVIYGSGWVKPGWKGKTYDVGDGFKRSAEAKKAEIENRPGFDPSRDAVILVYAPTEKAYIEAVNKTYTSGKIAEVVSYSHGTNNSINLGGNQTDSDADEDERWLSVYDVSGNTTDKMQREFNQIDKTNFEDNCRVTLYGCNLGGTGTTDADNSPAQEFANVLGGNATSNALQGGGGAEFKQKNGKNVYDGQMIRSADRKSQKQKLTEFKPKTP